MAMTKALVKPRRWGHAAVALDLIAVQPNQDFALDDNAPFRFDAVNPPIGDASALRLFLRNRWRFRQLLNQNG